MSQLLRVTSDLIKFQRTLFTLPFVVAGALLPLALGYTFPSSSIWFWGLLGFVAARTAGMAFNEVIDRKIDAANSRTAHRVLPSNRAKPWYVFCMACLCLGLFMLACEKINPLLFALSPLPALLIAGYSYTKRFTSLCHVVLGAVYLFVPLMAWVAVTGEFSWLPVWLGVGQAALIAGSDILYATQDYTFDKEHGIYSLPAKLGVERAVLVARLFHMITVASLLVLGVQAHLGTAYFVCVGLVAFVLYRAMTFHVNAIVGFLILVGFLWRIL